MRHLTTSGGTTVPISDAAAAHLNEIELIYPCGDEHDFHLQPDFPEIIGVDDLEYLVEAVHDGHISDSPDASAIRTATMSMIMQTWTLRDDQDKIEARKAYILRNMAMNIANTLLKEGYFQITESEPEDALNGQGTTSKITADLTVVKSPSALAFAAKQWIIDKIKADGKGDRYERDMFIDYIRNL